MSLIYTWLYIFFLPAFILGTVLKKTQNFFSVTAIIGLILSVFLIWFMGPASTGPGGWGLGLIFLVLAVGASIFSGVIAGTWFRKIKDVPNRSEAGIKFYFWLIPFLFIPLGFLLAQDYQYYALKKARSAETQAKLAADRVKYETYWKDDISVGFWGYQITLPVSTRLELGNGILFDGGRKRGLAFLNHMEDPVYAKNATFNEITIHSMNSRKVHRRWCELRPEMVKTFWCLDKLNVKRYELRTEKNVDFDKRQLWLKDPQTYLRGLGMSDYRIWADGETKLIIHETLGKDKRGEDIFSVCRKYECVFDYAIEADILVQIRYRRTQDDIADAIFLDYIDTIETLWASWQNED